MHIRIYVLAAKAITTRLPLLFAWYARALSLSLNLRVATIPAEINCLEIMLLKFTVGMKELRHSSSYTRWHAAVPRA
jgi:hypothetical protein